MMSNAASVLLRRRWATSSLSAQPGDLGLLGAGTPDPGAGGPTRQDAGVTQPAPLGDLGGVQGFPAQVRPTTTLGDGRLIGGQVVELLRGRERPPTCWATKAWL
jgi:hypothetical protein